MRLALGKLRRLIAPEDFEHLCGLLSGSRLLTDEDCQPLPYSPEPLGQMLSHPPRGSFIHELCIAIARDCIAFHHAQVDLAQSASVRKILKRGDQLLGHAPPAKVGMHLDVFNG